MCVPNKYQISENLLQQGFEVKLSVGGTSMFPYLLNKEQVRIVGIAHHTLKTGDIVIFKNNGHWIAHRLLSIKKHHYLIKGDFCINSDPPMQAKDIIGKVTGVYRRNKYIDFEKKSRQKLHYIIAKISPALPPFVWFTLRLHRLKKSFLAYE